MGARAFDPALLDFVDACTLGEEEVEDFTVVEACPICGARDLVRRNDDVLVTLDDVPHLCSEEVPL